MRAAVVLALLAAALPARAEPAEPGAEEVYATQPLALLARGISGSYERRIAERLSLVGIAGLRAAALEDYSSRTVMLGGELRIWVREATPMRGPFVAYHASVAHTRLADDVMDRHVGSSTALAQRIDAGWRFVFRNRVAISPTLGIGVREDLDWSGALATTIRPAVSIGLELGWMR